ncbi:NAD(P)/FAD-dependent oxidoreductase [Pseudalkalibacillus caeni]|nr:FAD-dependent oxidoreductase [Pseudalkalibacillus caeni]
MKLYQGELYWPSISPEKRVYKPLKKDAECEVLIIGGGESGALCSFLLGEYDIDTIVVEKNKIGNGVSAGNSGSLQFMSDKMLSDMIKEIGPENAIYFYKLCQKALDEIARITSQVEWSTGFERKHSLYFASNVKDLHNLKTEYELLSKLGFPVTYMDKAEIQSKFPFSKPGAIYSLSAARFNPVKFCQAIIHEAAKKNVRVYEDTEVLKYDLTGKKLLFETSGGTIKANKVIFASGFETLNYLNTKKISLTRTQIVVTNPIGEGEKWYENALIWETKRPYQYIRISDDHRLILGGLDENETEPVNDNSELRKRSKKLVDSASELFPNLELKIDYEYNAVFATTFDGRPFIGEHPAYKNAYFLLGFGGNGTIYSMMGATILRDLILYGYHPAAEIVKLGRSMKNK